MSHLPRESATYQAVNGERARWGESEHLTAVVIDLLQAQMTQFAQAHAPKGRRPKRPKPYPRPGVKPAGGRSFGSKRMTTAEADRWLASRR